MLREGKEFVKIGLRRNIKTGLSVCYGCVKVSNGQSQGRSESQGRSKSRKVRPGTAAYPSHYQDLYRAGELEASWKAASCELDERAGRELGQATYKEEATMTSYTLTFIGDYASVETAVKAWDKAFRRFYCVYGGYRVESGKTVVGQFFVTMKYTARWTNYLHAMRWRFQRVCDAAVQMLNRTGFDWDTLRIKESKE